MSTTTLWRGVIPSISSREGIDVTATVVTRTGSGVEITYSFDDPEQADTVDLVWDAETAAHLADRLKLVEKALYAANDLANARERHAFALATCMNGKDDTGAERVLAHALAAYDAAMAALPLVITT